MDDELGNDEILVALQAIMNECITVLTVLLLYFMRRRRLRSNEYYQGFQRRYSLLHKIPKQIEHLDDVLYPDDGSCFDILRMNRNAFAQFCHLLEYSGGLRSNRNVTVCEQVAMFLSILAHHTKNRIVKHDYKRSGRTVSKHFHGVLNSIIRLHPILLAKPEPVNEDCTNERWKWFKGCLGALDGTYIEVTVPKSDRNRYRSRKGEIAVNVLAVCDREMKFIYVLSGWEGSAADSRVLRGAVTKPNGLRVPRGNYYLCDAGYTNGEGFLAPYRGVRYHLDDWGQGTSIPRNKEEFFNMKHSKARNVIERAFGLLKKRWAILRSASFYPVKVQNRIIMACCLIHNFIRTVTPVDPLEAELENEQYYEDDSTDDYVDVVESSQQWTNWRDNLATAMYNEWRMAR